MKNFSRSENDPFSELGQYVKMAFVLAKSSRCRLHAIP